MSEIISVESNEKSADGHPHDLLARLYREIGISAVAAALEVSSGLEEAQDSAKTPYSWAPLGDDLAA